MKKKKNFGEAIKAFRISKKNKLLLISQTTYSLEKFRKIEEKLKKEIKNDIDFVVKNTICRATELRQNETEELSKTVDSMIIIGGKNSSNTKKIYELSKKNCKNTILIETAKELQSIEEVEKIGIMAGASTPQESIEEVIEYIKKQA